MKIVVSNNVVVAANENLQLTLSGILGGNPPLLWINPFYTTTNAVLVDNVTLPDKFFVNLWSYSNGVFTVIDQAQVDAAWNRLHPVPQIVSPRQMELALLDMGLLDSVLAVVNGANTEVQIKWNRSTEFHRNDPLWDAMVPLINKTSADVDNLFRLAITK